MEVASDETFRPDFPDGGARIEIDVVSGTTVLIVDDNADNREVYGLLLELSGYTVLQAADGLAGVQQAHVHHPDVILMDISMPVMDGFRATELLKLDPTTRDIPVVAVTAHDDPHHRDRASQVGMSGFVAKPAAPRRVVAEVKRCLENGGGTMSSGETTPTEYL
jgi:two-component system, cell cycle response regulator DivK